MRYQFLGTAAAEGVPGIYCDCDICENARKLGGKDIRTRSQSLVNDDLLIDFSADTYLHVLRDNLPIHKIFHCIVTHAHEDHFYPKELMNRIEGYAHLKDDRPFNVYGSKPVLDMVRESVGPAVEAGVVVLHELADFKSVDVGGYKVTPLPADHPTAIEPLIYFIERDGKSVLHANDTGYFLPEVWEWLENNVRHIDFAEFDCTFGLMQCRENHMGFDTVIEVRNRLKEMGLVDNTSVCVINHFSHNVVPAYDELRKISERENMLTSYDGMIVEF